MALPVDYFIVNCTAQANVYRIRFDCFPIGIRFGISDGCSIATTLPLQRGPHLLQQNGQSSENIHFDFLRRGPSYAILHFLISPPFGWSLNSRYNFRTDFQFAIVNFQNRQFEEKPIYVYAIISSLRESSAPGTLTPTHTDTHIRRHKQTQTHTNADTHTTHGWRPIRAAEHGNNAHLKQIYISFVVEKG